MKQLYRQVQDAYTRDSGRSVVRIDDEAVDYLGASFGDILQIRAESTAMMQIGTVAKCMPLYPSDEGLGIARCDKLVRKNAGDVSVGDKIILRKIPSIPAKKVTLTQVEPIVPVPEQYPPISGEWITDCLESMPMIKGDMVMVPYYGGRTWFRVMDVKPDEPVIITRRTRCKLTI